VIDDELLGMIFRAGRGIAMSPETLALEAIQRASPSGNFLSDAHTRKFLRQEHYLPRLIYQRLGPAGPSLGEADLLQAAYMRARLIWETHPPHCCPKPIEEKFRESWIWRQYDRG